jgi:hypothetical protein
MLARTGAGGGAIAAGWATARFLGRSAATLVCQTTVDQHHGMLWALEISPNLRCGGWAAAVSQAAKVAVCAAAAAAAAAAVEEGIRCVSSGDSGWT